eukprot:m.59582 g.59582  ORF g.59582 m.59582 type:complete len:162 (+) comp11258_c0_seq4:81-566(+)
MCPVCFIARCSLVCVQACSLQFFHSPNCRRVSPEQMVARKRSGRRVKWETNKEWKYKTEDWQRDLSFALTLVGDPIDYYQHMPAASILGAHAVVLVMCLYLWSIRSAEVRAEQAVLKAERIAKKKELKRIRQEKKKAKAAKKRAKAERDAKRAEDIQTEEG